MKILKLLLVPALMALICSACATTVKLPSDAVVNPALIGTWENSEQVYDNNGTGWAKDTYQFGADGSFTQNGFIEMNMSGEESSAELQISFKGGGKYGVAGGRIYFDFFPEEADASLQKFNFKTSDGSMSAGDEAKALSAMKSIIVNPIIKTMKRTMKEGQIYLLNSVDGDRLVISNTRSEDSEPQTFKKIK